MLVYRSGHRPGDLTTHERLAVVGLARTGDPRAAATGGRLR